MFDHQHGRRDVTYNDDSKGNKDFKKAIGLFSKSSTLDMQHTFFVRYLCRPLYKYNMKFPNRTFYGRRKQVYLATFDIFERDLIATNFDVIVGVAKAAYYALSAVKIISFLHTSKFPGKGLVRVDVQAGTSLTSPADLQANVFMHV